MLKTTRKSDVAYARLRRLIVEGQLPPGDRLTEHKLVRLLGVGRAPVRESLQRLQAEGFIDSDGAHRSKRVAYLEEMAPADLIVRYQLREVLEGLAARMAAECMTGKQINVLREKERQITDCIKRGDREGRHRAAAKFSKYLIAHCGHPLLAGIYETVRLEPTHARTAELDDAILSELPGREKCESWEAEVVEAIASHDPDKAEQRTRQWIRVMMRVIADKHSQEDEQS